MTLIRSSLLEDIPAITNIYAHHVRVGTCTFETEPPSQNDMMQRRADVLEKNLPYLVASDGHEVLGFAYCNWFKPRPAFRFSAEDSIYLAPHAQGQGIGRALMAELIAQAEQCGVRKLIAIIGDSANAGSIGLHQSVGYAHAGIVKSCGWKFDQWLDIVMMDIAIGQGDISPPTTLAGNQREGECKLKKFAN